MTRFKDLPRLALSGTLCVLLLLDGVRCGEPRISAGQLELVSWTSYDGPAPVTVLFASGDWDDSDLASLLRIFTVKSRAVVHSYLQAAFVDANRLRLECGGSYILFEQLGEGRLLLLTSLLAEAASNCNDEERGGGARLTHLTLLPGASCPQECAESLSRHMVLHALMSEPDGCPALLDVQTGKVRCNVRRPEECLRDPHGLSGSVLKVTYDHWNPVAFVDGKGELAGIMPDVFSVVARQLNVTVKYSYNPEPFVWGKKDAEGRWRGMIGQVFEGGADTSVAGFEAAPACRTDALEFTLSVVKLRTVLFARAPLRTRVSWENYLREFDAPTWTLIGVTAACLVASLHLTSRQQLPAASAVVLRALIGRASHFRPIFLSSKILHLTVLIFATVVFASYRSTMNAFLAVILPNYTVRDLNDVLGSPKGLTLWAGTSIEAGIREAPAGTAERILYEKFSRDPRAAIRSVQDGLRNVIEDDYFYLSEETTVLRNLADAATSCRVSKVPHYTFSRMPVTFPFRHGSRYTRPFNDQIVSLKNLGVVDRIRDRYTFGLPPPWSERCRRTSSGLGRSNVFMPFFLLFVGMAAGVAGAVLERLASVGLDFKRSRRPKLAKSESIDDVRMRRALEDVFKIVGDAGLDDATKIRLLRGLAHGHYGQLMMTLEQNGGFKENAPRSYPMRVLKFESDFVLPSFKSSLPRRIQKYPS